MKRRRHTPEQIIRKLREADRLLAEGHEIPEVAKQLEISEATYHRWRAQYGGLKADDVKRLKELEAENAGCSGSWPTRSSRSRPSRSWDGETGEPDPPTPRRGASPAGARVSQRWACRLVGQHRPCCVSRLAGQPQGRPAVVAGGGAAGARPAQTPAAGHLHDVGGPAGRRVP
jgi:putative transposase